MRARRRLMPQATLVIAILAVVVLLSRLPRMSSSGSVTVARIIDGDTVKLSDGQKVRYLLIDTPEKKDPFFDEATRLNESLVLGRPVRLELDVEPRDVYGRTLAFLFVEDEEGREVFVNAEIVRRGLATLYVVGENLKHRDRILAAQREAHGERRGLWKTLDLDSGPVVGTMGRSGRHRFHRPDCKSVRGRKGLVRFETKEEALLEGRSACRSCKP
jgi:micrococcal nuclease